MRVGHISILFAILGLGYVASCSDLTIKDFEACAVAPEQAGAHCDAYLTDHPVDLTQSEWLALSGTGYLCVAPTDYANIKIELQEACAKLKCSYEQEQAMATFFVKIETLRKAK